MNYVSYWDNVLPNDVCQNIINRFEDNKDQHEDTLMEGHRHFTEINISKHMDTWKDVQGILLEKMEEYLPKYVSLFKIDPIAWPKDLGFEEFRLKKYEPNGKDEFQFHADVGDYNSAKRFLVLFWYLNDVDEGGETTFQESKDSRIQFSCKPVTGRMIAFPPFWTHPHTGMKPISGPKYIIGTYLHYV